MTVRPARYNKFLFTTETQSSQRSEFCLTKNSLLGRPELVLSEVEGRLRGELSEFLLRVY
jgi:hypothetical protein